jgi:hypothetical protein
MNILRVQYCQQGQQTIEVGDDCMICVTERLLATRQDNVQLMHTIRDFSYEIVKVLLLMQFLSKYYSI